MEVSLFVKEYLSPKETGRPKRENSQKMTPKIQGVMVDRGTYLQDAV